VEFVRDPSFRPEEDEDLRAALAELWNRYKPTVLGQVDVLEAALHELTQGCPPESTQRHAAGEAHKLAGSLGSFGFPHGTDLAREVELALAPLEYVTPSEARSLAERVRVLRGQLDRHPAGAGAGDTPAAGSSGARW